MTGKNRLFSIGKLSTLTGVHIQSLRYYEELGILKPAYVDPQSGYRYYNFQHMRIVEAIQYCVELDIPLRQFRDFLLEEDGQIAFQAVCDVVSGPSQYLITAAYMHKEEKDGIYALMRKLKTVPDTPAVTNTESYAQ